jgi:RNA polymerase sigma-70 factor (ECF subfamily)
MNQESRVESWNDLPDERLMARYAHGDVAAFEELFRRHEPQAYAFFLKRTGSPDRAEDLYQELFLRIHRARHAYDPSRPFLPWFFQIAQHLLVDDARRAFREREVPLDPCDIRCEAADPEHEIASRSELGQLLAGLRPEERQVLVSAKLDGMEYAELAAQVGKSVAAVKQIVSRALRRIRPCGIPGPACPGKPELG